MKGGCAGFDAHTHLGAARLAIPFPTVSGQRQADPFPAEDEFLAGFRPTRSPRAATAQRALKLTGALIAAATSRRYG